MKLAWGVLLCCAPACLAQDFTQRGFIETRLLAFPQTVPVDGGRAVGDVLVRYEASYRPVAALRFSGAFDARTDTHHQVERWWGLSWQDRELRRPAFAVRRLSASYSAGGLTAELGKQLIRWGKADILNPTDRFAPRDFLNVVDNEFLPVTAARLTYERSANTFELVYVPQFTPSRIPLPNQRWVVFPENVPEGLVLRDGGARFPGGGQFGARWNRATSAFEYSLSFFDGFNHLPFLDVRLVQLAPLTVEIERRYAPIRSYGGDVAIPLRFVTIKGEAAYFTSSNPQTDSYVLYVVQLERQAGEWFFVWGYAGEAVTETRRKFDFAPDRGLTSAFLGRAGYTIDANRSVAFEAAVRRNGHGLWLKSEYSQAMGQHWRATVGFTLIRGRQDDFLGQYRHNSHATLTIRYSF